MVSLQPRGARQSLVRLFAEVRRRGRDGRVVSGHHNSNRVAHLRQPLAFLLGAESGNVLAKFRTPLPAVEVVPRIWRRESEILRVVGAHVGEVPYCLADFGAWSLHGYLDGRALAEETPTGPIGSARLMELAEFFARLAGVPEKELPPLPANWPAEGDSLGFLGWLARFAEREVHQSNRLRFGGLFDAVGIPIDAVDRFMGSVSGLTRRPFSVLHTDVHRANVVVVPGPGPEGGHLSVIDWELALYGDPLHDLATHLVRMDYDKTEQSLMTAMWADAMRRAGHADMTVDMDQDLPVYLGFEYVQSVFPDVLRAALALPDRPGEQDLTEAAGRIGRALRRAREPLGLTDRIPDVRDVGVALREWHTRDMAVRADGTEPADGTDRTEGPGSGQELEQEQEQEQKQKQEHGQGREGSEGSAGSGSGRLRRAKLMERTRRGKRLERLERPDRHEDIDAADRADRADRMESTGVGG
ncbi:aminoglycoside phosphotransferase family protein [Streptomyces sp. NPDC048484]|uniref:phosphotransferase family protein n=1 Tax=Streptomyces sp. NPDC048484 TaxID=3155146 RepID=UPI00343E5E9D